MKLSSEAQTLLLGKIVPYWEKTIRQYEKVSKDKKYISSLKTAIREMSDYVLGFADTMSWNTLNFIKESLVPLENQKILMSIDYYNNNNCTKWYKYIREISQMESKIRKTKMTATRGYERHYDMFGNQISVERY